MIFRATNFALMVFKSSMKLGWFLWLPLLAMVAGCTTDSRARMQSQNAYLAGQNAALMQQQQQQQQQGGTSDMASSAGVTIIGPVQNPHVPWVAGLTLAQALATANYLDNQDPKQIIITRNGESAALSPQVLFNGTVVPLEPGDTIEVRP